MPGSPHGLDDRGMRRLLGYSLTMAAVPALQVFENRIGIPFKLRRADYTLLVLVRDNVDVTPKHLARALRLSMPYLTVSLDRLQNRGLLDRVRSGVDRRSHFIRLTEAGAAVLREADAITSTMEEDLLRALTAGERLLLLEMLQKLALHSHGHGEPKRVRSRPAGT